DSVIDRGVAYEGRHCFRHYYLRKRQRQIDLLRSRLDLFLERRLHRGRILGRETRARRRRGPLLFSVTSLSTAEFFFRRRLGFFLHVANDNDMMSDYRPFALIVTD